MVKKRGLGKSLDALLSYSANSPGDCIANTLDVVSGERLLTLSVDKIQRGKYQPRIDMDNEALEALANSIRTQGIIQPLLVRPIGKNYEIIAGERRFRAAKMAGLTDVPVIVKSIPDEAALAIALIENIQREDLNPIEEAMALERLIQEFDMTHSAVAEAVGKSRTSVTNLLRLLSLPETLRNMLMQGLIEMGHARTLITLPPAAQLQTANMIVKRKLSVRETEQMVKRIQSPVPLKTLPMLDPDMASLQETLSKQLKLRVAISCNAKGKGKLVIHYRNLSELDQLLLQFQTD